MATEEKRLKLREVVDIIITPETMCSSYLFIRTGKSVNSENKLEMCIVPNLTDLSEEQKEIIGEFLSCYGKDFKAIDNVGIRNPQLKSIMNITYLRCRLDDIIYNNFIIYGKISKGDTEIPLHDIIENINVIKNNLIDSFEEYLGNYDDMCSALWHIMSLQFKVLYSYMFYGNIIELITKENNNFIAKFDPYNRYIYDINDEIIEEIEDPEINVYQRIYLNSSDIQRYRYSSGIILPTVII